MVSLHAIHLIFIAIICREKIEYICIVPPLTKPKEWSKYKHLGFYHAKTESNIYPFLIENKKYWSLRVNTLFGSLFTVLILLLIINYIKNPTITVIFGIYISYLKF